MKIDLDPYLVETLMPDLVGHDRRPSAYLVFLFLWFEARKAKNKPVQFSLREIAEATGISRRSVQSAVATLKRRKLIQISKSSKTDAPAYKVLCHWKKRR